MGTTQKSITATEALECLKDISDELWITDDYNNQDKRENDNQPICYCAMGHLNLQFSGDNTIVDNSIMCNTGEHFSIKVSEFLKNEYALSASLPNINDGDLSEFYPQETPKARVVQLLVDMIAKGY